MIYYSHSQTKALSESLETELLMRPRGSLAVFPTDHK
jgi:hypothetical protein